MQKDPINHYFVFTLEKSKRIKKGCSHPHTFVGTKTLTHTDRSPFLSLSLSICLTHTHIHTHFSQSPNPFCVCLSRLSLVEAFSSKEMSCEASEKNFSCSANHFFCPIVKCQQCCVNMQSNSSYFGQHGHVFHAKECETLHPYVGKNLRLFAICFKL